jgi:Calx-beta domain-containing protein
VGIGLDRTLTFLPGVRSLSVSIPVVNDTLVLLGARDTAVLTILDNDAGGVVQFSAAAFGATEWAILPCTATQRVSRTGGAAGDVTVDFVALDGSATAGVDYIATSGTGTFAAGRTSQPILVLLQIDVGAQPPKPSRSSSATHWRRHPAGAPRCGSPTRSSGPSSSRAGAPMRACRVARGCS